MGASRVNRFRRQGLSLSIPAGVAAWSLAETAQAAIQWSGRREMKVNIADKDIQLVRGIDVDGDGSDDFEFSSQVDAMNRQDVSITPLSNPLGALNAIAIDKATPKLYERLASVDNNENWDFTGSSHVLWSNVGDGVLGNRESMAFLGLRFSHDDDPVQSFAWMQVSVDLQNPDVNNIYQDGQFTIVSWAYEDVPGAPIPAGAVPEPTALLLLGGAAAVMFTQRAKRDR